MTMMMMAKFLLLATVLSNVPAARSCQMAAPRQIGDLTQDDAEHVGNVAAVDQV